MVKEPRQMKARTAHIVDRDMDFFIVGGFVEKVQVELAYELRQGTEYVDAIAASSLSGSARIPPVDAQLNHNS